MKKSKVRVIVCGLGFMGKVHVAQWLRIPGAEIVGLVEPYPPSDKPALLTELGLPPATPVFPTLERACEEIKPDAVDLCTPTYLHPKQAEAAFRLACHVFCEKPIALSVEDATAMINDARKAGRQLMIGHCIRFWPEYEILADTIQNQSLGNLLFLDMTRTSGRPGYASDRWTDDPSRCRGAALDMHIHDSDWLTSAFGLPASVTSRGVKLPTGWDYLATQYDYPEGATITARGGWCLPSGSPFRMTYQAVFTEGTLEFDSRRESPLLRTTPKGTETVTTESSRDPLIAYRAQLGYFVSCLQKGKPVERSTGQQARDSLRLVLAEIRSAEAQQPTAI